MTLRRRLRFLAELVAALLFTAMFCAFLLQVFTRYVLNDPVTWTQELVVVVYLWVVFWCGAFLLRERDHITFDMLFVSLPLPARRRLAIVMTALVGVAFVAALPKNVDYIAFMRIEKTAILRLRVDLLYSIFALFMAAVAAAAAWRLVRLLGPAWRDEVEDGTKPE